MATTCKVELIGDETKMKKFVKDTCGLHDAQIQLSFQLSFGGSGSRQQAPTCSFHVGNGCHDQDVNISAIRLSVFDVGQEEGFDLDLLDFEGSWGSREQFLQGRDNSVLITDVGDIIKKHQTWKKAFPNIEPFYAIKVNDDLEIVKVLLDLGFSFDCASQEEIRLVLDLGGTSDRIIYANTVKHESMLRYAASHGVSLMTFDNEQELIKISNFFPAAKLVLRIRIEGTFKKVMYNLGSKFGCPPPQTRILFQKAKALGLSIVGLSFHVGSGCQDQDAYISAIRQSRDVFDIGREEGFNLDLIDIGGGFIGHTGKNAQFLQIASTINQELSKSFDGNDVRFIAEPGRFFVESAQTLCVKVIGKRTGLTTADSIPQANRLRVQQASITSDRFPLRNAKLGKDVTSNGHGVISNIYDNNSEDFSKMSFHDGYSNKTVQQEQTELSDDANEGNDLVKMFHYFMNDGLYGHLNVIFFEPVESLEMRPVKSGPPGKTYLSTLWGPTCDSLDLIWAGIQLPEQEIGDWFYFTNAGAYWTAALTRFNNMPLASKVYFSRLSEWQAVFSRQPDHFQPLVTQIF